MPSVEEFVAALKAKGDDIIGDEERREGNATETHDPSDSGGLTQYGISQVANPDAFQNGQVTSVTARQVFEQRYIAPFMAIEDSGLLHQLVDFGINAGVETAIRVLQQLVGVTVDGQLGPQTLAAIAAYPKGSLFGVEVPGFVLLNIALRDARVLFYAGITKRFPKNLKFLLGWLKRAQEFK